MKTLSASLDEIERHKEFLNKKIEMVEQMEVENLECHLVLEHRIKAADEKHRPP